ATNSGGRPWRAPVWGKCRYHLAKIIIRSFSAMTLEEYLRRWMVDQSIQMDELFYSEVVTIFRHSMRLCAHGGEEFLEQCTNGARHTRVNLWVLSQDGGKQRRSRSRQPGNEMQITVHGVCARGPMVRIRR